MLANGNTLVTRQLRANEIMSGKYIVWNHDAPPGTEIHTRQPVVKDHMLIIQNGND